MQTLNQYDWPGNVRELENTLERVVLIHDKPIIDSDDIKYILDENSSSIRSPKIDSAPAEQSEQVTTSAGQETLPTQVDQPSGVTIDTSEVRTLKEMEHEAILAGLERNNWNMTTTSQQLGISRMTLYRKLDQHGLRKKD
jgi:two-component system response regulator AtoC